MIRASSYANKPPSNWMTLLATLADSTFFLMSRSGPTIFKIRDESDKMFKVTLGNPHACNCEEYGTNKYCIHIAYCIIKVLRIDKQHPIAYQTCFTDTELDQALSGQYSQSTRQLPAVNRTRRSTRNNLESSTNEPSHGESAEPVNKLEKPSLSFALPEKIKRKELSTEEENICPICQDDLKEEQALTWCRHGCGANLHAPCMMKYHQHKSSSGSTTLCPLCRETWDIALLKYDCQAKDISQKGSTVNCELLHCYYCKCLIRSRFYRCLECSQKPGYNPTDGSLNHALDYCSTCYQRVECVHERHRLHHFMMSDASIEKVRDVTWVPCKGPFANTAFNNPVLASLQERELTTNDYDLLLSLDDQFSTASLANYLLAVLPLLSPLKLQQILQRQHAQSHTTASTTTPSVEAPATATSKICWCATSAYSDISCVELLCGHTAHSKCIKEDIEVIVRQDISQLLNYRCAHEGCGKIMFRCIQRKKRNVQKKKVSQSTTPSTASNNSNSSLMIGDPLSSPTQRSTALLPISAGIRSHSANLPITGSSLNIIVGSGVRQNHNNNNNRQDNSPNRLRRYSTESASSSALPSRETIRQRVLLQRHREELLINDPTFSSSFLNVGVSHLGVGMVESSATGNSAVDGEGNYDLASASRVSTSNLSNKQSIPNRGGVVVGPGRLRPTIGRASVTPQVSSQSIQLTPLVTHINGPVNLGIAISHDDTSNNSNNNTAIPPAYTNIRATPSNSQHLRTIRTLQKLDRKLQHMNQQRIDGLSELQESFDQPLQLSVTALHTSRSQNNDDLSVPSTAVSQQLPPQQKQPQNLRAIRRGTAIIQSNRPVNQPSPPANAENASDELQQLLNVNHYQSR